MTPRWIAGRGYVDSMLPEHRTRCAEILNARTATCPYGRPHNDGPCSACTDS